MGMGTACVGEKCTRNFDWETERERPRVRLKHRWRHRITVDFKQTQLVYESVECLCWEQNRGQGNMLLNVWAPPQ